MPGIGTRPHPANGADGSTPCLWSYPSTNPTTQYALVTRLDQNCTLYKINRATRAVIASRALELVPGNPWNLPLTGGWPDVDSPWDAHCVMIVWCDWKGRVYASGNLHSDPMTMWRTVDSGAIVGDIMGAWEQVPYPTAMSSSGANVHSYQTVLPGQNGTTYWFGDQQEGPSAVGRDWLGMKMVSGSDVFVPIRGGSNTDIARTTGGAGAAGGANTADADRVYIKGYAIQWLPNGVDRLVLGGFWRYTSELGLDGSIPWEEGQIEPFFMYCDANPVTGNHTAWKSATGVAQTMPITRANANGASRLPSQVDPLVYYGTGSTIVFDNDDHPHWIIANSVVSVCKVKFMNQLGFGTNSDWVSEPLATMGGSIGTVVFVNNKVYYQGVPGSKLFADADYAGWRLALWDDLAAGPPLYVSRYLGPDYGTSPDPVMLMRHNGQRYETLVPDGDNLLIRTFGQQARAKVAP